MGKSRMEYKKKWRQTEKNRKRCNAFITEYTKIKYGNVYHEASTFYNALSELYPNKRDLQKTKEYRDWKKELENQEPSIIGQKVLEPSIIVQHLYTDVTLDESEANPNSDAESQNMNDESESKSGSDTESDTENNQNTYRDNMVLEIPLERHLPTTNPVIPAPPSPPFGDYEVFTDERLQEIVEELRDDPELMNIFGQGENDNEKDEGVELPTLEEEVILDFETFDYRLEVELAEW